MLAVTVPPEAPQGAAACYGVTCAPRHSPQSSPVPQAAEGCTLLGMSLALPVRGQEGEGQGLLTSWVMGYEAGLSVNTGESQPRQNLKQGPPPTTGHRKIAAGPPRLAASLILQGLATSTALLPWGCVPVAPCPEQPASWQD